MRKWVALGAGAVGAAVVGLAIVYPFLRDARPFPATNPQPQPLFETSLIPLKAGQEACMSGGVIDEHSEVAYTRIGTRGKPPQPLLLSLSAPGYAWQARHPASYRDSDLVTFPVEPPEEPKRVAICLRNEGSRVIDLYAAADRTRTRNDTFVDEEHVAPNFVIWFTEQFQHSFAGRSPTIAQRIATFRPGGPWVPWTLIILFLAGVPLALVLALGRAGMEDEETSA